MRKLVGWAAFLAGSWMLVSPQALMGLNQLKWMHQYAFSGEVLGGILLQTLTTTVLTRGVPVESSMSRRVHLSTVLPVAMIGSPFYPR